MLRVCVCVPALLKPQEGVGSSGAGIIGSWEPLHVGVRN